MPELTSCPECQRKLRVPENLIGQSVKCPSCAAVFTAAADTTAPPPLPASPQPQQERAPEEDAVRPRRRPPRDEYDDDYDDDYDDRPRRRRRRPDQESHRGAAVLALGIITSFLRDYFWSNRLDYGQRRSA